MSIHEKHEDGITHLKKQLELHQIPIEQFTYPQSYRFVQYIALFANLVQGRRSLIGITREYNRQVVHAKQNINIVPYRMLCLYHNQALVDQSEAVRLRVLRLANQWSAQQNPTRQLYDVIMQCKKMHQLFEKMARMERAAIMAELGCTEPEPCQ